jgi:tRNA U34 5-methylaminomethyl-2-thiouridine-forming methyltransferase MnmC
MSVEKTLLGQLGKLEIIETNDGSLSINSSFYDENCHSLDGAKSETIYNFIEGCEIQSRYQIHQPFVIFEAGLGMGYGLDCTLDLIGEHPLLFITTEIEPALIHYNIEKKKHDLWKTLKQDEHGHFVSIINNQKLVILSGDATLKIKEIDTYLANKKIHAIFQDAFSPKKNPELWSESWFKKLYQHSDQDCIMSTYCASRGPLEAMEAAGFLTRPRTGFGRKKRSTVATIK